MSVELKKWVLGTVIAVIAVLIFWAAYSGISGLEFKTLLAIRITDMTLGHIVGLIFFVWMLFSGSTR